MVVRFWGLGQLGFGTMLGRIALKSSGPRTTSRHLTAAQTLHDQRKLFQRALQGV